jgi:glycosyltransferase involved in cell wall biosynthesis
MKVLQIIRNRKHGGPSQHALTLTLELAAMADVAVVCQPGSWIADKLKSAGVKVHLVRMHGSLPSVVAAHKIVNIVRTECVDIVHGQGNLCALYANLAARWSPARAVSTEHSLQPKSIRWHEKSTAVIAVSDAVRKILTGRGISQEKIYVIRHGIPASVLNVNRTECRTRIRAEMGVDLSAPLAIAVGKAGWIKGHDLFFEAAALVRRSIGGAWFALLGSASKDFSPKLDRIIAEQNLSDAVIMTGHRTDAIDVIAAADLVVLPSRSESLSQTAIEAMAVGCPVVVSNVGGLPEVVASGETGIIVESENVVDLADAMVALLTDAALRSRLGAAGKRRFEAEFLASAMAERTCAVYRKALDY